jgi:response regulator RpfG family c-di-GMP phosphodiesterase
MEYLYFFTAPEKQVDMLMHGLKAKSFECAATDILSDLKLKCEKNRPNAIILVDNMKEKDLKELVPNIRQIPTIADTPIIGITLEKSHLKATIEMFEGGVCDVIHLPIDLDEVVFRLHLRIEEAGLQNTLTPNDYFFSESQEKEQGKRNGIYHFYDKNRVKVGDISIKNGHVVAATYGSIIKEDAFLQLAVNDVLSYRFEVKEDISAGKMDASVTNLLMEASKLKDEIKKQQEYSSGEQLKGLIVDDNRITRLVTNRTLKNYQIESRVIGAKEFTIRFLGNFAPNFLIIDYKAAQSVMDMIWGAGKTGDDLPVIIYCDDDVKNLDFKNIDKHTVELVIHKKDLNLKVQSFFKNYFKYTTEN